MQSNDADSDADEPTEVDGETAKKAETKLEGPLKLPEFRKRVVAVPMWPVTGGSGLFRNLFGFSFAYNAMVCAWMTEQSYVEFQRAKAELELWENAIVRERQEADAQNLKRESLRRQQWYAAQEQSVREAALADGRDPDKAVARYRQQQHQVHNPVANPMARRIARPAELRSEYVLLPYSWSGEVARPSAMAIIAPGDESDSSASSSTPTKGTPKGTPKRTKKKK